MLVVKLVTSLWISLGAEDSLNPQVQNQYLLQAVSDYCEQGELNKEQTQAVKKQVFEYCKGQLANGDEIALTEPFRNLPDSKRTPFCHLYRRARLRLGRNHSTSTLSLKNINEIFRFR